MLSFASAQLWTIDQDEALAFWTDKVGMEVRSDVTLPEMGGFRWLTVGPPAQPDVSIVLMAIPGAPVLDEPTQAAIRDLTAKGMSSTIFLTTEDCRAECDRLRARGVEFAEEPAERPYGIDAGFRDPSGNHVRVTQLRDM